MSKVSRSIYQKLAEENKRLIKDIKIIVSGGFSPERILLINKWRKHFNDEKELNMLLKNAAMKWMEDNPENEIVKSVKKLKL